MKLYYCKQSLYLYELTFVLHAMGICLCNQLIVRDVLVIRENYKAVMTCRELTIAGERLIGYLRHRVHKGGCNIPSQSIYTYNCMTHPIKAIRKRRRDVCRLVITCHFYMG